MMTRPIPIIILALIHFLEPLAKILYTSVYFKIPVGSVIRQVLSNPFEINNLLALTLFPIAGIAIWSLKRWSLFVVILAELISLGFNSIELYQNYATGGALFVISQFFLYSLNILVVVYLMLPAVRLAYIDPRVKWWESNRRFLLKKEGEIALNENSKFLGTILNLSRSGIYLSFPQNAGIKNQLGPEKIISINFKIGKKKLSLKGKVARVSDVPENNEQGVGLKFCQLTLKNWLDLYFIVIGLWFKGVPCRPNRGELWREFLRWTTSFLKTGKGLIPEYHK